MAFKHSNSHIGIAKFAIHPVLDCLDRRHTSSRGRPVRRHDRLVHLLIHSGKAKGVLRSPLSSLNGTMQQRLAIVT